MTPVRAVLMMTATFLVLLSVTIAAPPSRVPLGTLHQEARNVTFQKVACGRPDMCAYHKGAALYAPGNLTLAQYSTYPCFCDLPACFEFGDCCVDLMEDLWKEPRPLLVKGVAVTFWECLPLVPSLEEALESQPQHAWMVGRCPEGTDPELNQSCEALKDILGAEYMYVHDVPVIFNDTLYRNVFCAACHDISPHELRPMSMKMQCTDNSTTIADLKRDIYVPGTLRWELQNGNCTLVVRDYEELSILNAELLKDKGLGVEAPPPLRQCRPAIRSCPEKWEGTDTAAKCDSYALFVGDFKTKQIRYKNPHCGLCHNETLLQCMLVGGKKLLGETGSLSLIFHFSLGGDVVGHSGCAQGFVWDELFRRCLPVFSCEPGARYRSANCPQEPRSLLEESSHPVANCDRMVLKPHEFIVLDNGSLLLGGSGDLLDPDKFKVVDENVEVCAEDVPEGLAQNEGGGESEFSALQGLLTLVCTCVSLLGLALHVAVMCALPRLRNLPGLIAIATSLALFAAQALFLWATGVHRPSHKPSCVALAVLLHFSFLQVFSWTTVMSYDIWRTFSHPTGHVTGSRHSSSRRTQFTKYVVFTSTVSTVLVASALTLDLINPNGTFSPGYAYQSSLCWFGSRSGLLLFFAIPVCALLLCNVIMYAAVVVRIREQRRAARLLVELRELPAQRRYTEGDCKLHFSIFNVMGGTWMLGLLAGLVNHPILWHVFIILNGSQGALIFVLQIMKPRVWGMIKDRLNGKEMDPQGRITQGTLLTSSLGNKSSETNNSVIKNSK